MINFQEFVSENRELIEQRILEGAYSENELLMLQKFGIGVSPEL